MNIEFNVYSLSKKRTFHLEQNVVNNEASLTWIAHLTLNYDQIKYGCIDEKLLADTVL